MDVSIVIVNWNTRGSLGVCLESLYANLNDNLTYEIFVVDNGSSDGSVAFLRGSFPGIQVLENPKNLGFARANNQALRMVQGRYVLLLNTDVRLLPGSLNRLLDYMSEHPETAMVGGQLLNPDGSRQNSFSAFPSLPTELFNKSLLKILFPWWYPGKCKTLRGPTHVASLIGACMLVRSAVLTEIGLMDEAFFFFFEETDWCARMRKGGWEIVLVPDAQFVHAQGRGVDQDKHNAAVEYYRSRTLYFRKHKPLWQLFVLRGGLWVKLIINWIWAATLAMLTLGRVDALRQRLGVLGYVLGWHLRGCPRWMGLANAQVQPNLLNMKQGKVELTACLITRNEEKNVCDCLESLRFVSDIIVIDSFSEDQTAVLCRRYTDNVFQAEWQGFSATKNLCVDQAQTPWVLVIDADERVTPELRAEILDLKVQADGFYVPRQNYFLGKWIRHGGWSPDYTLRLFLKAAGRFKDRAVHEAVALQGSAGYLKNPFLHFTYRDLSSYITRLNRYSTLAAQQLFDDRTGSTDLTLLRRVKCVVDIVTRPAFTFLRMFFLQLGFLDGIHGLLLATHHSFYVLAKYAKFFETLSCAKPPASEPAGNAAATSSGASTPTEAPPKNQSLQESLEV